MQDGCPASSWKKPPAAYWKQGQSPGAGWDHFISRGGQALCLSRQDPVSSTVGEDTSDKAQSPGQCSRLPIAQENEDAHLRGSSDGFSGIRMHFSTQISCHTSARAQPEAPGPRSPARRQVHLQHIRLPVYACAEVHARRTPVLPVIPIKDTGASGKAGVQLTHPGRATDPLSLTGSPGTRPAPVHLCAWRPAHSTITQHSISDYGVQRQPGRKGVSEEEQRAGNGDWRVPSTQGLP